MWVESHGGRSGIHQKCPLPRIQTLAHLTAYTTVVTYPVSAPFSAGSFWSMSLLFVVAIVMVVAITLFYVKARVLACITC